MTIACDEPVVLTGGTGFLGTYLCAELLTQTSSDVYVLARGRTAEGAQARLRSRLRTLNVPEPWLDRVVVVPGDLGQERLGLCSRTYETLARSIRAVYHCGAWVNLVASEERLKSANVDGTREIVRLAAAGSRVAIHHISSLAIFAAARGGGVSVVTERTVPRAELVPNIGYTSSKVAGEQSLEEARRRGIPVRVYRPGLVIADSKTGREPLTDLLVWLIRAAVDEGAAPECSGVLPFVTVDYAARAIVALSKHADTSQDVFHVMEPSLLRTSDVFDHARAFGYRLAAVSIDDWQARLRRAMSRTSALATLALWEAISYMLAPSWRYRCPHLDCSITQSTLSSLGVAAPSSDDRIFRRLFTYLVEQGVLPPLRDQVSAVHASGA